MRKLLLILVILAAAGQVAAQNNGFGGGDPNDPYEGLIYIVGEPVNACAGLYHYEAYEVGNGGFHVPVTGCWRIYNSNQVLVHTVLNQSSFEYKYLTFGTYKVTFSADCDANSIQLTTVYSPKDCSTLTYQGDCFLYPVDLFFVQTSPANDSLCLFVDSENKGSIQVYGCDPSDPNGTCDIQYTFSSPGQHTVKIAPCDAPDEVIVEVNVILDDCGLDFTYSSASSCVGSAFTFTASSSSPINSSDYCWTFSDSTTATGTIVTKAFNTTGEHWAELRHCDNTIFEPVKKYFSITSCGECSSFYLVPKKRYLLTTWVSRGQTPVSAISGASVKVTFAGSSQTQEFFPSGPVIDGWQKIEEEFVVPASAVDINIEWKNTGSADLYIDDVRIQPFEGAMKSFVYDPMTMKFISALDENHFSTFYNYDQEGKLIRVKKETERGVKTLREIRQSSSK